MKSTYVTAYSLGDEYIVCKTERLSVVGSFRVVMTRTGEWVRLPPVGAPVRLVDEHDASDVTPAHRHSQYCDQCVLSWRHTTRYHDLQIHARVELAQGKHE